MPDTTVADQRAALRAWVARGHPGDDVAFVETHVSILALGAERVWKLKKAVRFPFVDLSTRELRRRNCEREVALNRRLARDVYLGVIALDDEHGAPLDWLVEMRRMPDDRRLGALAASAAGVDACVDAVAALVARFHHVAPTGGAIDACATVEFVRSLWTASIDELRAGGAALVGLERLDAIAALASRYLDGHAALFAARIAEGRARDGHGDLLADDVFCLPDGPRALDCLEFDDHLRFSDTLADVAFLAMDLERLGRADLARRFLDRYASEAGDHWPASLEHLYVAYRAVVRAKVAVLRAADGDAGAVGSAEQLLALAQRHLRAGRVRLLVIGGPPASGKSTLARAVGDRLGWPVLRSDVVRKRLAGLGPDARRGAPVGEGIYTDDWTARTYRALLDEAGSRLALGESVVLDASWSDPAVREQARRVAESTSSDLVEVCCVAPDAVRRDRAARRLRAADDASDATPEVAATLGRSFAAWPTAHTVDGTEPVDVLTATVVELLDR